MEEYLNNLKVKYSYNDQMIELLSKVIDAFINVLGEEYTNIILNTIANTIVFQYDNTANATNTLNEIINDGNNHQVGPMATGTGFMEDYYTYNNGEINQNFAIGIDISCQRGLFTMVHELCHAISTYNKITIEDNIITIKSGLNFSSHELVNGKVSRRISNEGVIFNEMLTENLAMQIMDYLEPEIVHEPTSYQGYVNDFNCIFIKDVHNKR